MQQSSLVLIAFLRRVNCLVSAVCFVVLRALLCPSRNRLPNFVELAIFLRRNVPNSFHRSRWIGIAFMCYDTNNILTSNKLHKRRKSAQKLYNINKSSVSLEPIEGHIYTSIHYYIAWHQVKAHPDSLRSATETVEWRRMAKRGPNTMFVFLSLWTNNIVSILIQIYDNSVVMIRKTAFIDNFT